MSKLEEKIIKKGELIVEGILSKANEDANLLYQRLLDEAKKDLEQNFVKESLKLTNQVDRKKLDSERAIRDEVALAKQKLIENIFDEIKLFLKSLDGKDLFNYVVKAIQKEVIEKNETILVSKHEYDKYAKILSSKTGKLIEADLLNKALGEGYQLKLSNVPAPIPSGFMLEGKDFDLNFSYEETLEKLSQTYEKKIYEDLN